MRSWRVFDVMAARIWLYDVLVAVLVGFAIVGIAACVLVTAIWLGF